MRDMGEMEWDSEPEDGKICDSKKENVLHCPIQECINNTFKKAFTLRHWLEVHMPPVKRQECKKCQRVFRRLFDVKRHKKEMGSKLVVRDSKFFVDP